MFEAFNTRAHHNYEGWGHGWEVKALAEASGKHEAEAEGIKDLKTPIKIVSEFLVCAVEEAMLRVNGSEAIPKN
jgi:hypothetical protein